MKSANAFLTGWTAGLVTGLIIIKAIDFSHEDGYEQCRDYGVFNSVEVHHDAKDRCMVNIDGEWQEVTP